MWRGGGHPGPSRASDACRALEGPSLGLTSSRQGLRGVLAEAGAHLGSLRPDTEGTQIGERSVSNLRALGSPECDCGEGPCSFGALPRRLLPDCPGGGVGEGGRAWPPQLPPVRKDRQGRGCGRRSPQKGGGQTLSVCLFGSSQPLATLLSPGQLLVGWAELRRQ